MNTAVVQLEQVNILHTDTHKHTLWSVLASCFPVGMLICRLWHAFHTSECLCEELWDEDRDMRFMSFQVHHIKYFANANLQVHSCQPCK